MYCTMLARTIGAIDFAIGFIELECLASVRRGVVAAIIDIVRIITTDRNASGAI